MSRLPETLASLRSDSRCSFCFEYLVWFDSEDYYNGFRECFL